MVVHCDICNVDVPSVGQMKSHLLGKRHKRNAATLQQKARVAKVSVFVSKFPRGTQEAEIAEYFSKAHEVRRVTFSKDRTFAFVEFTSPEVVEQVIDGRHYLRGKLLHVRNMHVTQPKKPTTAVTFNKPEAPLMSTSEEVEAKARAQKLKLAAVGGTINEQMVTMVKTSEVTLEERRERNNICFKLQTILQPFFPGCFVNPFGSSVNGFGISGCDMDIFLDLTDVRPRRDFEVECPHLPYIGDFPNLTRRKGPFCTGDLEQLTAFEKIKLLSRILSEHASCCHNLFTIPSVRCPVIRFVHQPSNIKCDISINNKLALQNTRLLYLYSNLDSRIRPIVYTIRNWAKFREIAGNENSGPRLSNYCLVLMALHYLQNTDPPVIPTLSGLRDQSALGTPVVKTEIDGWDCSFIGNAQLVKPSQNTTSHDELLLRFLQYYADFDFDTNVICTSTGQVMVLPEFLQMHKDTEMAEKMKKFKLGAINIQDPFVLNHNISFNVNEKTKLKIVDEFKIAVAKFSEWIEAGNPMNSLADLWSGEIPLAVRGNILSGFNAAHLPEGRYAILLTLKPSQLSRELLLRLHNFSVFRLNWCRKVCTLIHSVFVEIMLFKCHILSSNVPELTDVSTTTAEFCRKRRCMDASDSDNVKKSRNTDPMSKQGNSFCIFNRDQTDKVDLPEELFEIDKSKVSVEMMIQSPMETWTSRKQIRQELMFNGMTEGKDLERAVSLKLCPGVSHKSICEFRCMLSTFAEASRTAVLVSLEPIDDLSAFQVMYSFLKPFLTKFVEKHLSLE